ncbi:MAG TPA: nuclear transport factor 2 family protein [Candidatus Limnocylindrales bacterium]|nr:nuclear transport factor 2 family protein [Candidatus Limnocylindrales bacterium]
MANSRWMKAAIILGLSVVCAVTILAAYGSARPPESHGERGANSHGAEEQIRELLGVQQEAWNRGDIDSFMGYYWKSGETLFIGANGVTRGWQAVLERYHHNYPDRMAMGRLTFSHVEVHLGCEDSAFVVGQFQLQREKDSPAGVFTLDLRKFPEGWRIVADHTTGFAAK